MFYLFIVLSALKGLFEKKDIVHCDISYSNILLLKPEVNEVKEEVDNEGPLEVFCPGLIIDFEYAAHLSEAYAMSPGRRTVHIPFPPFYSALLIHLAGYIAVHGN
jgi:serine/threonine protein kinase